MKYKHLIITGILSIFFTNIAHSQTIAYGKTNTFNPPSHSTSQVHHYTSINHTSINHTTSNGDSRAYGLKESMSQTKKAEKGVFATLNRKTKPPIQIQKSWNKSNDHSGIVVHTLCPDCTYKVITREEMITTIVLPTDAHIKDVYIGDNQNFEFRQSDTNKVIVRPMDVGLDTNLSIVTTNHVYMFYLRSESWNSKHRPDLLYVVKGKDNDKLISFVTGPKKEDTKETTNTGYNPSPLNVKEIKDINNFYVRGQNLISHFWSSSSIKNSWLRMKPELIMRDDKFTYLVYNKDTMKNLKDFTAYEVNAEKKDENINRRRVGNMIVLETLADKISLRQESNILCIDYKGSK